MTATILVVEDDRLIRDLVSKALHRDGHQVLEAHDGAIALELFKRYDIVITDFVTPKLDGIKSLSRFTRFSPESL